MFCVVLEATLANVVAELRERVVVGQVSLVWDMPGNTSSCKFGLLGFFLSDFCELVEALTSVNVDNGCCN